MIPMECGSCDIADYGKPGATADCPYKFDPSVQPPNFVYGDSVIIKIPIPYACAETATIDADCEAFDEIDGNVLEGDGPNGPPAMGLAAVGVILLVAILVLFSQRERKKRMQAASLAATTPSTGDVEMAVSLSSQLEAQRLAIEGQQRQMELVLQQQRQQQQQAEAAASAAHSSSPVPAVLTGNNGGNATEVELPASMSAPFEDGATMRPPDSLLSEEAKPSAEVFSFLRTKIDNNLIVPSSSLKFGTEGGGTREVLGRGAFGDVFFASYLGSSVAVKELNVSQISSLAMTRFVDEALLMSRLRHPHIVQCLGLVWEPPKISLLMELCSMGALYNVLRSQLGKHSWVDMSAGDDSSMASESSLLKSMRGVATKTKWVVEVAKGMMYLHNQPRAPIIHRDLKCQNVLLDAGMTAKITDFGESRENAEQGLTTEVGTPYLMAPEVFTSDGDGYGGAGGDSYGTKVDVYSFGMMVLEIYYDGFLAKHAFNNMSPMVVAHRVCGKGWRPDLTGVRAEVPHIAQLIELCWQQEPAERPTFEQVVEFMKQAQAQVQVQEAALSKSS
jgi:hypothetical protein